jgi:hypothetical protein
MMPSQNNEMEQAAILRAERSISCLPFKRAFYEEIDRLSLSAEELCEKKDWNSFVFLPFGPERAEEHFQWMIKIGILRREVDGQGLTSRIRLTPMGRKVISRFRGEIRRAGLRERCYETLRRYQLRL